MPSMPRSILNACMNLVADMRNIDQAIEQARAQRDEHRLGELTNPLDVATVAEWGPAGPHDRPSA